MEYTEGKSSRLKFKQQFNATLNVKGLNKSLKDINYNFG
jgi:hypothetical protein